MKQADGRAVDNGRLVRPFERMSLMDHHRSIRFFVWACGRGRVGCVGVEIMWAWGSLGVEGLLRAEEKLTSEPVSGGVYQKFGSSARTGI